MTMKINFKSCTIELTKGEMKEAETFGSKMYQRLREARADFPTFSIKLITTKKNTNTHKGLTQQAMKKFIETHESEDEQKASKLSDFYKLCGLTADGKEKDDFGCAVSYGELRQWFFAQYPQYEDMSKAVDDIMNRVRQQLSEKKAG